MALYRKRPVVISAVQWDGNPNTANDFVGYRINRDWRFLGGGPDIEVWNILEGCWVRCPLGHYLIRGIKNEIYPCEPATFTATYEAVPS